MKAKKGHSPGFTLVELLIVVAIIAILAAVAVPAYAAQMERSRESVDEANLRTAKSMAVTDYLVEWATDPAFDGRNLTYYLLDAGSNAQIIRTADAAGGSPAHVAPQAASHSGRHIEVEVAGGGVIVSAAWVA